MENLMMSTEFKNTSYVFIPFRYNNRQSFKKLVGTLDESPLWSGVQNENLYMLKYVADKFDSQNPEHCQCFLFELKEEARPQCGLAPKNVVYATEPHPFHDADTKFTFTLPQVQLYCFSTSVCILAFRLHFTENDPFWIATAQYHLKKVSRETITPYDETGKPLAERNTILDLAKNITTHIHYPLPFEFFFYANPSTERANSLTYLDVPAQSDYKRELYYLRRCYGQDYVYVEDQTVDRRETYCAAQEISWGISPEAAICLAQPCGHESFVHNIFYKNFNRQYLFMYVLLLHQKYVLYMLLTKIGVGNHNQLETLTEYQHQLYEFETDFVFSRVTEVPQYQNLYDRLADAFSLKPMFDDVREPLSSLSEIRKTAAETKQRNRDLAVNRSLFMLSLLTFFSALMDSFDFAESFFSLFFNENTIKWIQFGFISLVVIAFLYVLFNLISSRKD